MMSFSIPQVLPKLMHVFVSLLGKHAIELVAADPHSAEIRSGDVTIDESTYTRSPKGEVS
jgi:hypothetical protein